MLTNLKEFVKKAKPWFEHFNLKHDKWYPDALDSGHEAIGIYVGTHEYGGPFKSLQLGFAISFSTVSYYHCQFTLKYHCNLWPVAVEEWVE